VSGAWIRRRPVPAGTRNPKPRVSYQVLFRRGGRATPIETAGTFKTEKDARARRDLIAGWLAVGLNPRDELAAMQTATRNVRTPGQWAEAWLASRHDIDANSERTYMYGVTAVLARLGTDDLAHVTVQNCADTVARLAADYAPATVANYWAAFSMLLEYVGVEPNPAKHRTVKLPRVRRTPPNVPTHDHVEAMLRRLADRFLLPFAVLEQTAARVETIDTATWEFVDVDGLRLRVTEKGRKVRWVPVPEWLMLALKQTCPAEDRLPGRQLFPNATSGQLRNAMGTACRTAEIPHYTPHDLRHRRASMWHLQGIPDAVLAERLGHEKASFSKDVYAHVMPAVEMPQETWEEILVVTR
jgi:integrase